MPVTPVTIPESAATVSEFHLATEVISKPGAVLEVKVVKIPQVVKEAISTALQHGQIAAEKK